MAWTALVPARGGSKGVRGKNLRPIHGRPLILHTLDLLTRIHDLKVVVSTDSHHIKATVLSHYPHIEVWDRPEELGTDTATIDDVAAHYFTEGVQPLLVVQPTTFGLERKQVTDLISWATEHPGIWVATQRQHGIYWLDGQMVNTRRSNRQDNSSLLHKEIGLRAYSEWGEGRIQAFPLHREVTEIDTLGDFTMAEVDKKMVALCFSAAEGEGWGHLHRTLTLYEALQHHRLVISCTHNTTTAARKEVEARTGIWPVDSAMFGTRLGGVFINDTLDTSERRIGELIANGWKVITLEDQGSGARLAHITINALYGDGDYNGVKYAVLRPEFLSLPPFEVRDNARRILISFGGEDYKGLGEVVSAALRPSLFKISHLKPPALTTNPATVAYSMQQADLLITSAGRTVYEAMAVGIPTVVMAANLREARHCHLGPEFGNVYLGLAEEAMADMPRAVGALMNAKSLRREMSMRGREMVDGRGVERIVRLVEDLL